MYISLFLELSGNGNAKYKKEFETAKEKGRCCIVSSEYSQNETDMVWVIPEEVLSAIDAETETKSYRDIVLKIKRIKSFEDWMEKKIIECTESVEGLLANGFYYSVKKVCNNQDIPQYILADKEYEYGYVWGEEKIRNLYTDMSQQMELVREQKRISEEELQSLKEHQVTSEKYIRNLEKHATDLDLELKYYKSKYENNDEERKEYEKKIEKLKKDYKLCMELYKKAIADIDTYKLKVLKQKD